jgi:hypothetical protein
MKHSPDSLMKCILERRLCVFPSAHMKYSGSDNLKSKSGLHVM